MIEEWIENVAAELPVDPEMAKRLAPCVIDLMVFGTGPFGLTDDERKIFDEVIEKLKERELAKRAQALATEQGGG